MGVPAVNDEQNTVIQYVKDHLVDWMEEKRILPFPQSRSDVSPQLLERMVRVEEAIKFQNEKFDTLINQIDRRFDDMDKRFDAQQEYMDKRFDTQQEDMDRRFEAQQQDMDRRFETQQKDMDRRFEAQRQNMDRRFDEMNRRFNRQGLYHLATFTAIVTSAVAILLNS